jgi:hypothetical protein
MEKTRTAPRSRLLWADVDYDAVYGRTPKVGDVLYLVTVDDLNNSRPARLTAQADTPRTNMSREVRTHGWLGTTNNVYAFAEGQGTVKEVREAEDGWRVRVRTSAAEG